jgi:copper resistance protein D
MPTAYYVTVTLHVLAALIWLGGLFFFGLVGAPALRRIEPPSLRQELFNVLGTRFRTVAWICIAILIITGLGNLQFRGWTSALSNPGFWSTATGMALGTKLGSVAVMIVISAIHDFAVGPASSRLTPGTPEATAARRRASVLGRLNAVVGLVLVIAAVRLARA